MQGEFLPDQKEELKEREKLSALDKSFRTAEISRRIHSASQHLSKQPTKKKTFLKSGFLIIIFALIGIGLCVQNVPWAYVSYVEDYGPVNEWISAKDPSIDNKQIENLFDSYESLGISLSDFHDVPTKATYGFICLAILGLLFIVFQIIDKSREFSIEQFAVVHCLFAVGIIILCAFIILLFTKFLGAYFIIAHNLHIISDYGLNDAIVAFLIPILAIILYFLVMKGAFTIIKANYHQLLNLSKKDEGEESSFANKYRGKPL